MLNARLPAGQLFHKKVNCLAHVQINSYTLIPELNITDKVAISAQKLQNLKLENVYRQCSTCIQIIVP